jgi:hypothetical protein
MLHRRGRTILRVPIEPEGIADLVILGWVDCRQCFNPSAVADAIIDVANAVIATGLRPG